MLGETKRILRSKTAVGASNILLENEWDMEDDEDECDDAGDQEELEIISSKQPLVATWIPQRFIAMNESFYDQEEDGNVDPFIKKSTKRVRTSAYDARPTEQKAITTFFSLSKDK